MAYCALERSFWVPESSDGVLGSLIAAMAGGEAILFNVALPSPFGCAPPLDAVFALAGAPTRSGRHRALTFTWSQHQGFPLPTISGEIVARRLGSFVCLRIRASYAYADGAAGRLFHETVGSRLGRKAFEALAGAIKLMLAAPAGAPKAARETLIKRH